jgi:hypothetical protein
VSDALKTAVQNFSALHMLRLVCLLFFFLALSAVGCGIPVSRTMVIPESIAQDPEHLIAKLDLLQTGMSVGEVFQLLDIKRSTPGVREVVTAEEKQRILYGATQVIGSPEELEHFRGHLGKLRIIEIRFRDIEDRLIFDSAVSVVNMRIGPDFISYIVFYQERLVNLPSKPENFYHQESRRVYISDLFGTMLRVGAGRGVGQIGN